MAPPQLTPGAAFGRYVVLAPLGRGGIGEVLRARDTKLDREVALKIVRSAIGEAHRADATNGARVTSDATIHPTDGGALSFVSPAEAVSLAAPELEELLREARLAAAIEHPNVVSIFEIGQIAGTAFLAMELIVGCTLREWARDASLADRLRALATVARALAAAHARGVVHRDVKPDNVMMRDDGVLKVLDFGIARRARGSLDPHAKEGEIALRTMARTGEWGVAGTPAYMAPEQLRGERLDARCDQFAWGVMAFELLAGERPWPGQDPVRVVAQMLDAAPSDRLQEVDGLPRGVAPIVLRALRKDRSARFDSMSEVADAVDAALRAPDREEAPPPPRRLGRVAFAVSALFTIGAAFVGAPHPRPAAPMRARAPLASAPSSEAWEAFDAAMRSLREASLGPARRELARATALDRSLAAAHLWRAVLADDLDDAMHAELADAMQYRAALSPVDAALLHAVEPWSRAPADWLESERRLVDAAARFPGDARIPFVLGRTRYHRADYDGALAAFASALERDSGFAAAVFHRGLVLVHTGDASGAEQAFRACVALAPGSTSCLGEMALDASAAGRCREASSMASHLAALDPASADWGVLFGQTLLSDDPSSREARRALEAAWPRLPPSERRTTEPWHRTSLDILGGDFAAAERDAASWEEAVDALPDAYSHLFASRTRMQIALERGDRREAASLADRYLRRQSAWIVADGDWSTEIFAFSVEYRAGAWDRARFAKARDGWLARETARAARSGQVRRGLLWVVGFAMNVVTRQDAIDALDALPRDEPMPSAMDLPLAGTAAVGETYRLAGRTREAREWLGLAAASCQALDFPMLWVQSSAQRGLAEEEAGDRAAACDAYDRVLRIWGAAAQSATASLARARVRALGCARPMD